MIITCEACGTTFKLKANLLKATGTTVRCSKCEHVFTAYPQSDESAGPAGSRNAADAARMPYEQPISEEFYKDAEETERELDSIFDETAMEDDEEAFEDTDFPTGADENETSDLETVMDTDIVEFQTGDTSLFEDVEEGLFDNFETDTTAAEYDAQTEEIGFETLEETSMETVGFDDLSSEEEVISLEDLETTDEIVGLGSLVGSEPEAVAEIDLDILGQTAAEDELELDALEKTAAEDEVDFDALEKTAAEDEALDMDSLQETAAEEESETAYDAAELEGFETAGEDDAAEPDLATEEEVELLGDSLDAGDEQRFGTDQVDALDWGVQSADPQEAEQEGEPEKEGGFVSELDDFDKKPENEVSPEASEDDGKSDGSEELDLDLVSETGESGETADGLDEDLDLDLDDLDLDLEVTGEEGPERPLSEAVQDESAEAFDLDLEATSEEDLGLDLDLDEFDLDLEESSEESSAEGDEFDLDLDLDEGDAQTAPEESAEEEFEFSLEEEVVPADDAEDETAEAFELDLDLEEDAQAPEGAAEEEFDLDLDFESEEQPAAATAEADEFDLDLDLDADDAEMSEEAAEDAEFEIDLEEAPEAEAEFDLSLDEEDSAGGVEDSLDFELDLEEVGEDSANATAEVEDFELDLDMESDEEGGEKGPAPAAEADEFDLTDVEDFLDVEEESGDQTASEEEAFDFGFETAADVTPTEAAEEAEFDIDLETMLDEESGRGAEMPKEVSLETVGDRRTAPEERETAPPAQTVPQQTAPAAPATAGPPEDATEVDTYPEETESFEAFPGEGKRRRPLLWVLLVVLLLALLAAGAYFFLYGQKAPEVRDAGNLQIAVSTPEYRFVNNDNAGELLVVTGSVTNRYDQARKYIEVQANLYDATGKLIRRSKAFAGNTLKPEQLKTYDLAKIEKELANRKGDNGLNVDVTPNEKIPFTVIFSKLPDNLEELSVEVVASFKN